MVEYISRCFVVVWVSMCACKYVCVCLCACVCVCVCVRVCACVRACVCLLCCIGVVPHACTCVWVWVCYDVYLPHTCASSHLHERKRVLRNIGVVLYPTTQSHVHHASFTDVAHTPYILFDGYCSTVQGLLDWFEVDLGFTWAFIYSNRFVCSVCFTDVAHTPYIRMTWHIHTSDVTHLYVGPGYLYVGPGYLYVGPGYLYVGPGYLYVGPGYLYGGPGYLYMGHAS